MYKYINVGLDHASLSSFCDQFRQRHASLHYHDIIHLLRFASECDDEILFQVLQTYLERCWMVSVLIRFACACQAYQKHIVDLEAILEINCDTRNMCVINVSFAFHYCLNILCEWYPVVRNNFRLLGFFVYAIGYAYPCTHNEMR